MTDTLSTLLIVGVSSICTAAVRFLPFVIFIGNKEIPPKVQYLGEILPSAIIATLVVYCLKDISFVRPPNGIPEILSVALVAFLQYKRGSVLLSIGGGTLFYIFLANVVFI